MEMFWLLAQLCWEVQPQTHYILQFTTWFIFAKLKPLAALWKVRAEHKVPKNSLTIFFWSKFIGPQPSATVYEKYVSGL